jgi:tRNA pseudouridine13 synthase
MTEPPEIDRAVGMEVYATAARPCRSVLRSRSGDFRVEEVLEEVELSGEPFPGCLPLYRVEKTSVDTLHMGRAMAEALRSRVSFAGMKDKRATTTQYLTPTSSKALRPVRVDRDGFSAVLVGYVERPLARRAASGNRFRIVLRECCSEIRACIEETYETGSALRLPNFFGLQRFGAGDALTHIVGKELVRRRFREALEVLLVQPRRGDGPEAAEARRLLADGNYEGGYRLLPNGQDVEKMAVRHLMRKPQDVVGAIRAIPIKLRRLYVNAFQSYLFNRTVSLALRKGLDISGTERGDNWAELSVDGLNMTKVHGVRERMTKGAAPVVQLAGFAYRNYGSRFDSLLEEVMREEEVSPREFYVEAMQEVSAEGGFRRPHLALKDAAYELADGVATMEFTLPRGGYATVLLREVVKPTDPVASGFT